MEENDIRWKQRFQNFDKAFHRLERAVNIVRQNPDNDLLQAGLIQTYEFTFELAWKTLKDYLESEGFTVPSPKSTIRQAFQSGYIQHGDSWMKALNEKEQTLLTYDEQITAKVIKDIENNYIHLFSELHHSLSHIISL